MTGEVPRSPPPGGGGGDGVTKGLFSSVESGGDAHPEGTFQNHSGNAHVEIKMVAVARRERECSMGDGAQGRDL